MSETAYRIEGNEKILRSPTKPIVCKYSDESLAYTEVPLKPDKLLVTQHPGLDYTHYLSGNGEDVSFEMYLSNEARELMKGLGWKRINKLFQSEISRAYSDPFGESNIDSAKDDPRSQKLRSVNKVGDEIEKILGKPVAIKGTGKGLVPGGKVWITQDGYSERENLIEQYIDMRYFQKKSQEVFDDEQKEVLEFCPVYAAIRYPVKGPEKYQEWLIMKRAVDGHQVEDHVYTPPIWYNHGRDFRGFDEKFHPDLAKAFGVLGGDWNSLFWRLNGNEMNLGVSDISGRNILWTVKPDGKKFYTIIDQRFRGSLNVGI